MSPYHPEGRNTVASARRRKRPHQSRHRPSHPAASSGTRYNLLHFYLPFHVQLLNSRHSFQTNRKPQPPRQQSALFQPASQPARQPPSAPATAS
ncbi:hypothetical protein CCHR01_18008 [Colletotrichum chrysophilum]|uniref:Uncharacterized protein n=1 Tax=Colletotrichum chrysophilum TaxID=1836956 RepID=A0AAD9A391_9PEZI|nr:hypothetical protein CCHR01_18008 [Colletotrichum chrysophilum]